MLGGPTPIRGGEDEGVDECLADSPKHFTSFQFLFGGSAEK
jgi:hypothetical protein